MLIDTHCHLDDDKIVDKAFEVKEATKNGVLAIINMSCDERSIYASLDLANSFESVYFGVGVHPENARNYDLNVEKLIENVAKNEKCVAVGEIGLDYHYDGYDKNAQINAFVSQLNLANKLRLPVSIHSRDATKDMVDLLCQNKSLLSFGGVMHCYSGSIETAKILLDLGIYFSFGGTVTFKNARQVKEVAEYLPTDRILTETDSPYLAPHPYRGTVNGPKNIPLILNELALIKGVSNSLIEKAVEENSRKLFYKLK